jgi:hypothetical protein
MMRLLQLEQFTYRLSKKSWILVLPNMLPALVFLENKDSLALIDAANVDRLLKFIQKKNQEI